jgi:hypothetical protein
MGVCWLLLRCWDGNSESLRCALDIGQVPNVAREETRITCQDANVLCILRKIHNMYACPGFAWSIMQVVSWERYHVPFLKACPIGVSSIIGGMYCTALGEHVSPPTFPHKSTDRCLALMNSHIHGVARYRSYPSAFRLPILWTHLLSNLVVQCPDTRKREMKIGVHEYMNHHAYRNPSDHPPCSIVIRLHDHFRPYE